MVFVLIDYYLLQLFSLSIFRFSVFYPMFLEQTHSSICELMLITLCHVGAMSVNMTPSFLTGFNGILVCFGVLYRISLLPAALAFILGVILFRGSFTIIKPTNTLMNVNIGRQHFDILRSSMMTGVCICIFMCDFKTIWNPKFGKTINSGVSLMDLGVISFTFINAFTRTQSKIKIFSKKLFFIMFMGVVRLIVVTKLNYDIEITEYGKHLNFYFLLGIYEFSFGVYKNIIRLFWPFDTLVGSACLFLYYRFVDLSIVMNDNRSTFIMQNKEGISSIIPCFCIYLIINDFSRIYERMRWKYLLTIFYTIVSTALFIFHSLRVKDTIPSIQAVKNLFVDEINAHISRRCYNLSFVLYGFFIGSFTFLTTFTLCKIFPHSLHNNRMVEYVSKNLMFVFLMANGGIIVAKWFEFDKECNRPILTNIVYLFVTFLVMGGFRQYVSTRRRKEQDSTNLNKNK